MKRTALTLLIAAGVVAASAQTPSKPAAPASTSTVHHTTAAATGIKLPPGVPPAKGIVKPAFTLRIQDIKLGTGALAEPNKMYKVQYTGYLGSNGRPDDGRKFDSSYDHPGAPVLDKDGKPVMDADGKPKHGDPQPLAFPQGMGRLIPGFDQGFGGMKIGGKRRLFIPWQLAYGAKGRPGPDAAHPGIPPKADLIFDVELVDVTEPPAPPSRPGMPGMGGPGGMPRRPMPPGSAPNPGTPGAPGSAAPAKAPGAPATPGTPVPSTPPATTSAPTTTPAAPATTPAPPTPTPTTPQPHL